MRLYQTYLLAFLAILLQKNVVSSARTSSNKNLEELDYRIYPKRTAEEAAVLEWGHSAIISALDASVALFGPQTVDAALLEVECQPVLASPLNGIDKEGNAVDKFANSDETHGNMVVMTNTGKLSGYQMAKIALNSGAAALLVVNMDEKHPDDIYRLELGNMTDADMVDIDIPICMISLNSANVLTTATVTPDMKPADIVNNGMPDRIRLYAGADRPFFEDVEPVDPTLYLIHNLMTEEECDSLVKQASHGMDVPDSLLLSHDTTKQQGMDKVVLWKGALQSYAGKQVEERIEQVTGFPATHYSDFVVYKLTKGSLWKPHYDILLNGEAPMATITVFLSNSDKDPTIVYPSLDNPVKIVPQKGMAIVHHNLENQRHELDMATLHAWMPSTSDDVIYVARKYVFSTPQPVARRVVLPILAAPFGGTLPSPIYKLHALLVDKFGHDNGDVYFDKICVFVPVLIVLCLAQAVANYVQNSMGKNKKNKNDWVYTVYWINVMWLLHV